MDKLRLAAVACLAGAIALFAYALAQGQLSAGLFVIVPFVYGTGGAAALATLLLMAAMVLWTLSAFRRFGDDAPAQGVGTVYPHDEGERRVKHGGVVLLGPIPIVWGSDRRVLPWMVGAGALLLVAWLVVRAL